MKNSLSIRSREIFFCRGEFCFEISGSFLKSFGFTRFDDCYWSIREYIEFIDGEWKWLDSYSRIRFDELCKFKSKDYWYVANFLFLNGFYKFIKGDAALDELIKGEGDLPFKSTLWLIILYL